MKSRLISIIRASRLWCSDGHLESPGTQGSELAGLDLAWYFRTYYKLLGPAPNTEDCAQDYIRNDGHPLRSPNLAFDELWYRHAYPSVTEQIRAGRFRSGWAHYLAEGASQRLNPNCWFDEHWYERRYCDVHLGIKNHSLQCAFEHFLLYGIAQDLSPSLFFNVPWYRRQYLSNAAGAHPLTHFLRGRHGSQPAPTPLFDADWYNGQYLKTRPDPPTQQFTPFEHYLFIGRRVGHSPSPYFHEAAYRAANPDVSGKIEAGLYQSGLEHYFAEGMLDGLIAPRHIESSGVDYTSPAFLQFYEQSVTLNLKHVASLREFTDTL